MFLLLYKISFVLATRVQQQWSRVTICGVLSSSTLTSNAKTKWVCLPQWSSC